jgi:antitoxin (DNA-binding transcriptional repressor) of toxin-antitoxin stability system
MSKRKYDYADEEQKYWKSRNTNHAVDLYRKDPRYEKLYQQMRANGESDYFVAVVNRDQAKGYDQTKSGEQWDRKDYPITPTEYLYYDLNRKPFAWNVGTAIFKKNEKDLPHTMAGFHNYVTDILGGEGNEKYYGSHGKWSQEELAANVDRQGDSAWALDLALGLFGTGPVDLAALAVAGAKMGLKIGARVGPAAIRAARSTIRQAGSAASKASKYLETTVSDIAKGVKTGKPVTVARGEAVIADGVPLTRAETQALRQGEIQSVTHETDIPMYVAESRAPAPPFQPEVDNVFTQITEEEFDAIRGRFDGTNIKRSDVPTTKPRADGGLKWSNHTDTHSLMLDASYARKATNMRTGIVNGINGTKIQMKNFVSGSLMALPSKMLLYEGMVGLNDVVRQKRGDRSQITNGSRDPNEAHNDRQDRPSTQTTSNQTGRASKHDDVWQYTF